MNCPHCFIRCRCVLARSTVSAITPPTGHQFRRATTALTTAESSTTKSRQMSCLCTAHGSASWPYWLFPHSPKRRGLTRPSPRRHPLTTHPHPRSYLEPALAAPATTASASEPFTDGKPKVEQ